MGSSCHAHGLANGGPFHFHAVHRCSAPESQVANLSNANARALIESDRASADRIGVPSPGFSSPNTDNFVPIGADVESPPHSSSAVSLVVLRI
jgi:hypothetical protein